MKAKRIYILIFVIFIGLFGFCFLNSFSIIESAILYFNAGKDKLFLDSDIAYRFASANDVNLLDYLKINLQGLPDFDPQIFFTESITLIALLVPISSILLSQKILEYKKSIDWLLLHRVKGNAFRYNIIRNFKLALKFSFIVFMAYCLYSTIVLHLCGDTRAYFDIGNIFMLDILGTRMYQEHVFLFYFISGFVSFGCGSFVISFISNCFTHITNNKLKLITYIFIYFYGVLFVLASLGSFINGLNSSYFNPMVLLLAQQLTYINVWLLLLQGMVQIVAGILILKTRNNVYEI